MRLVSLRLHDFRSYQTLMLTPPEGVTVIVGENGAGKTNLLEAVHLCCLGRSHRTSADGDMIRRGQETAAVQLVVARRDGRHDVGIRLYQNQRRKKLLYVNGKTASRMGELMGHATCVMFSPEDLAIVKDGPHTRRRFMDMLLSECQRAYFYALQTYNATLRQRNALLKLNPDDAAQLDAWDAQLAEAAAPVVRLRAAAAQELDRLARAHYAFISGRSDEKLSLSYIGQVSPLEPEADLLEKLRAARAEDMRRMTTTIGPHRDDLMLMLSGHEIRAFGSQGQARTAALSLKLAAFDMLTDTQGEPPLLLLDDVLSELDPVRRRRIIERIKSAQALITCTDPSDFTGASPACVLKVADGHITQEA